MTSNNMPSLCDRPTLKPYKASSSIVASDTFRLGWNSLLFAVQNPRKRAYLNLLTVLHQTRNKGSIITQVITVSSMHGQTNNFRSHIFTPSQIRLQAISYPILKQLSGTRSKAAQNCRERISVTQSLIWITTIPRTSPATLTIQMVNQPVPHDCVAPSPHRIRDSHLAIGSVSWRTLKHTSAKQPSLAIAPKRLACHTHPSDLLPEPSCWITLGYQHPSNSGAC